MINIFNIGACRTMFEKQSKDNDTIKCIKNSDLTHTTKEVLMYLDLFENKKSIHTYPKITSLMYEQKLSSFNIKKHQYLNSDVITIEISSFKLIKENDYYYQINRSRETGNGDMERIIQTEEDFANDIKEINERIKKPIIYMTHLNLDYYDIEGLYGYIEERERIDDYVKKYCDNFILPKNVFYNMDYKEVCDFYQRNDDTTHINNDAKMILFKELERKVKYLLKK